MVAAEMDDDNDSEARRGRGLVGIARTAEEDLRGGDAAME